MSVLNSSKLEPCFELRVFQHGPIDTEFEIWQLPSLASPHITTEIRVAGLRGRSLELVKSRVLKQLSQSGVNLVKQVEPTNRIYAMDEELALNLGLLFRTLAPMRNLNNMRAVADGIEAMEREETAYWLGMAMHRKYPRRVLTALRYLLTDPKRNFQL